MPQVSSSSLSQSSNSITLTGTGFTYLASPFVVKARYAGVEATSVTLTSTTATLLFSKGIPIAQSAVQPELYFENPISNVTHWAQLSPTATLANPLTTSPSVTPLSCSFAGGCLLSVSSYGLYSTLKSTQNVNQMKVCGQVCEPSDIESTQNLMKCKIQALATTYSTANYNITQESYLVGQPFSSEP
jgi:hypothetical protein